MAASAPSIASPLAKEAPDGASGSIDMFAAPLACFAATIIAHRLAGLAFFFQLDASLLAGLDEERQALATRPAERLDEFGVACAFLAAYSVDQQASGRADA
jgi:hypothetical protein